MDSLDTADLDAQIAQLEALKQARLAKAEADARQRSSEAAKVLVHDTPTKAKPVPFALPPPPSQPKFASSASAAGPSQPSTAVLPTLPSSRSSFAAALAQRRADDGQGLTESAAPSADLPLGPGAFGPDPEGGDEWRSFEPNSGIRLSKRAMSHIEVQEHLRGRYFFPPARIYALARLNRDGATYSVPVDGEWVTIAVVAERSGVRISGAKGAEDSDDGDYLDGDSLGPSKQDRKGEGKRREKAPGTRRKYISLKLVSLPASRHSGGPSDDAHLQLLLFEADAGCRKGAKASFRRSAYEKWSNLAVGSVVAIVSPRILRPLKTRAGRGEFASATTALEGMYRAENKAGVRRTPQGEGEGATYVLGAGKVVHTGQRGAPEPARPNKRHREDRTAVDASLARLLERKDDNSPGAMYLRAAEAAREGTSVTAKATPTARRHVFSPAAINAIGFDPNRSLENSGQRAALIASLKQPVDRRKLVRKPREPSPEMIDLD
ncbi:hypothetical protein CspeluHIS016_0100960 [Cutaneotrichosporon spelunceum]|uniref:Uncharacterized protein n=1 Tax=Cutaneotrichosporon spelunceum TaxID=1672016 RepID=A0AAD3Y793_9TREE|nr:hypothetical protein CspeluHIS016_0100960 [Cutaneotrichosporon spelunceum]